jgi:hypothetical protein
MDATCQKHFRPNTNGTWRRLWFTATAGTCCDPVPLEELQELIDIGNRFGTATVATEKGLSA